VLNNREGRRVAVIVNDISEVNIDADLIRADTELRRTDETLVEMSNGASFIRCAMIYLMKCAADLQRAALIIY